MPNWKSFINEDGPVPSEAQRTAVAELRRVASDRLADGVEPPRQARRADGPRPTDEMRDQPWPAKSASAWPVRR
jgi:hypothetical protein